MTPWHQIAFFILLLSFFLPMSESIDFKISSFAKDTKNILYSGDATPSSGAIELNRFDDVMRVGHVTYADAVQIWDKKTTELTNFTTHFTFVIDTLNQTTSGGAFSFFLAPVGFQIPPNSAGEFLGLFNITTYNSSHLNQLLFVEFDTFVNNPEFDPRYPHVGININSVYSLNSTYWNASLHSGDPADASVSYNATTQMLTMSLSYAPENTSTTLSYKVDLRNFLPEFVTIGFSGTTGFVKEKHTLKCWEFSSSLVGEEGIEDNNNSEKRSQSPMRVVVPLIVPVFVSITTIIIAYVCVTLWSRPKDITHDQSGLQNMVALTSINVDLECGMGPKRFALRDLAWATNFFSDDMKLGKGGFGCVYKGLLSRDGTMVAVKQISQGSKQGKEKYTTEVKIIGSLTHQNLVRLIGWCHDKTQFLLVYEFMPNGSLDSHLFHQKNVLKWDVRYNVAKGLASALLYLHEECDECVLHRDIKASNIMLDSGFNAKLGDFGLAQLMNHEMGLKTTGLVGTLGYMSPEYATTGKASKDSDVYSFGVVALEIACGKMATGKYDPESDLGLVEWVWGLHGKTQLLSGVDPMLNKEFKAEEVECLMMVGLWCSHPNRSLRPSIRQVIQVLKFERMLPSLPMRMPVPTYFSGPDGSVSSSATMTNSSIDLVR